jgi:CRP/FNR family cyclic AMP-dependent transcriptional regulator
MSLKSEFTLHRNPWLNNLPEQAKEQLISAAKIRRFTPNQRVHSKGDEADGLYCLMKGEIRVGATTLLGNEFVFTRIQPGDWFGEIAILDNGVRTHDGSAVVESEIAIIPTKTIRALCDQYHEVYRALTLMLCTHTRQAFHAIDELLIYSNEQRLANIVLLRLAENDNQIVAISQEELGAQIGISRQSINKLLKKWQNKGWIKRIYNGFEVIKAEALSDLSK